MYGKSATLWLADMECHREKGSSPSMYFHHIDRHLEGEAAEWVKNTRNVRTLIYRGYVGDATESDIDAFYGALSDRFKHALEEPPNLRGWVSLIALRQGAGESIEQYTGRFRNTFPMPWTRDAKSDTLTSSEMAVRIAIIAQYTLGLYGKKLRDHLCEQFFFHPTPSMNQAQKMAEAATRMIAAEEKIEATRIIEAEEKAEARKSTEQESNESKKRKLAPHGEEMENGENKKHKIVSSNMPRSAKEDGSSGQADQAAKVTVIPDIIITKDPGNDV